MQKILFIWQPTKIYSDRNNPGSGYGNTNWSGRFFTNIKNINTIKANPRKADYCMQNALDKSICPIDANFEKDLVILGNRVKEKFVSSFNHIFEMSDYSGFYERLKKEISGKDMVILLYPDAIGQGYKKAESIVLKSRKKIYILNGRKRFFELNRKTWMALRFRRAMEKYLIFEMVFSLLFPFFILPYFLFEKITRKSRNSFYRKSPIIKLADTLHHGNDTEISPEVIADYWSSRPQTYGTEDGKATYMDDKGAVVNLELGNKEFFDKVDETCYSWNRPLHINKDGEFIPFSAIFDYAAYRSKPVLEIGCGMGTMAMNWAQQGAMLHAVDLSDLAIEQTKERFRLHNLKGVIQQADARKLPFPDNYFNYVYSWGVLHHSPHIEKSIEEIHRVLVPGGKAGIMLYHRKSFLFRYFVQYSEGFLHFENRFLSLLELASRYGDGYMEEGNPYTYPVTKDEVLDKIMPQFRNIKIRLLGTDLPWMLSYLCFPYAGRISVTLVKSLARRFGWSMWIEGEK
jgi:ubiquinone/menaquinone biosynthesis C-methylase UbiE